MKKLVNRGKLLTTMIKLSSVFSVGICKSYKKNHGGLQIHHVSVASICMGHGGVWRLDLGHRKENMVMV